MSGKRRKICIVITARPSYARIKSVLEAVRDHPDLELQLVVAASALLERYGRVIDVIKADGFNPVATVYMLVEGENLVTSAKSTGIGIVELSTIFDNLKPDIVVSVADRYETIATAIAASYLNIPVGHVQGGEVTGSIDEKVRHAVTKLSNLHFVASQEAKERVLRMGEDPDTVYATGCPSIDIAERILSEKTVGFNVYNETGGSGVGHQIDAKKDYIIVMQHPVPTEDKEARMQALTTLQAVHEVGLPTFWFWPNVDAGSDVTSNVLRAYREQHDPENIYFLKNLSPENFIRLLRNAKCIAGNSSVAIREASFLGVPAVNIGTRQRGRERGPNIIDVGHDKEEIAKALLQQASLGKAQRCKVYGDGQAGKRIADILATAELNIDKQISY
ncbi:MAG: UDP-N-acetylglucosamine 2-epimerase (hydrolyzing) [Rhodospirillaceae bacterium]|jgi:UDP-hydrolysing UDP-N-acetyl-D-glucosamine 2-epimerase|nr:UDP-N-acetylglucosamine 2-epimerase (hydrolyzing) [Rhodospirillaceae bacterium]MBT5373798.1 UDP-N-acetylglucosamine 2-epimerase (hydrolyzing) [Rhodospirillaceae bacterium]